MPVLKLRKKFYVLIIHDWLLEQKKKAYDNSSKTFINPSPVGYYIMFGTKF